MRIAAAGRSRRRTALQLLVASVVACAVIVALLPSPGRAAGAVDCSQADQQLAAADQRLTAAEVAYEKAEAALAAARAAQQQAQTAYTQAATAETTADAARDAAKAALDAANATIAKYDATLQAVTNDAAAATQIRAAFFQDTQSETDKQIADFIREALERTAKQLEKSTALIRVGSIVLAAGALGEALASAALLVGILQLVRAPFELVSKAVAYTFALGKMLTDERSLDRLKPDHDAAMAKLPALQAAYHDAFNASVKASAAAGAAQTALDAANAALQKALADDAAAHKELTDAQTADNNAWQAQRSCSGGSGAANAYGDPHLITFDGAHYDFQQVGEFIAARSDRDDFQVQVRQAPWAGTSRSVAANIAVAERVAGHRVGVYLATGGGVNVRVDGQATTATSLTLPGGGTLSNNAATGHVTTTWPDGSFVIVDYSRGYYLDLSATVSTAQAGHIGGLLGNANGNAADDLATRDGTPVPYPATPAQLYGAYAASWRLVQAESLFDYGPGQSTATFTDLTFPSTPATVDGLPAAVRQSATATCTAAGVTDPAFLTDCILDVGVTGDANAALSAATAQIVVTSTPTPGNLLTNGSFENPSGVGGFAEYGGGSTAMPGWTVGGNSIDQIGGYWTSQDGAQSLDMAGGTSGSVSQTVATKVGTTYTLSWYEAGNPVCGQSPKVLTVTWNGTVLDSVTFDTTGHSTGAMGWTQHQLTVKADTTSTTIVLADATPDRSQCGVALDNVALVAN